MLGLLDPAATDPAGHARAATATIPDLEQLAERYLALYPTADPAALLTPVVAHIRMASAALAREHTTAADRHRLLRNRATVATLAGRLASDDLGDAPSGRAYYSLATDSAREADDHQAAAIALGYTAQLAHAEGMTAAALDHLAAALTHAEHAPALAAWLASISLRPVATPPPPRNSSTTAPTPPAPPACVPSAPSPPARSAPVLCASSTNTSPTSPPDRTSTPHRGAPCPLTHRERLSTNAAIPRSEKRVGCRCPRAPLRGVTEGLLGGDGLVSGASWAGRAIG